MAKAVGQFELPFPNRHGGRREGAGRKRSHTQSKVAHRARPGHTFRHPVHVTLSSAFRPLRSQFVFPTVRWCIVTSARRRRGTFRVVHFSVQENHLHLLVEAEGRAELHSGIKGLAVSIAKRVNRLVFRSGRFFDDRWHGRALTTPRAVRHALVYVLANTRKHSRTGVSRVDPFSSAPYFDGFAQLGGRRPIDVDCHIVPRVLKPPNTPPDVHGRSWLLTRGWRRWGLISLDEGPRTRHEGGARSGG